MKTKSMGQSELQDDLLYVEVFVSNGRHFTSTVPLVIINALGKQWQTVASGHPH